MGCLKREEDGSTPANLQVVKGSSSHLSNKISLDHSECFSKASAVSKGTCRMSAVSTKSWSFASCKSWALNPPYTSFEQSATPALILD